VKEGVVIEVGTESEAGPESPVKGSDVIVEEAFVTEEVIEAEAAPEL